MSKSKVNGILLLYYCPFHAYTNNMLDHVSSFSEHSRFRIWPVNTFLGFPKGLNKLEFSIILLHYSLFYKSYLSNSYQLAPLFLDYLNNNDSYKIAFFQDEHHTCVDRFKFINEFKVDCIYTLLKPGEFDKVYGKYTSASRIFNTLPAYVSSSLITKAQQFFKPDQLRTIDVGYRGRILPPHLGKAGQEKIDIARCFLEYSKNVDLRLDISTKEEERFIGDDWYSFLANCKCVLGVEAGTSIFDLEDQAIKYSDSKDLNQWEDKIYYRTIAPRNFEAAAFRVCQILFEGKYSSIMVPMKHYIPLKKDFSNIEDVLKQLTNSELRSQIASNAYKDLIQSGRYSYEQFIRSFDEELIKLGFSSTINEKDEVFVNKALSEDLYYRKVRGHLLSALYYPFPGRSKLVKMIKKLGGS